MLMQLQAMQGDGQQTGIDADGKPVGLSRPGAVIGGAAVVANGGLGSAAVTIDGMGLGGGDGGFVAPAGGAINGAAKEAATAGAGELD